MARSKLRPMALALLAAAIALGAGDARADGPPSACASGEDAPKGPWADRFALDMVLASASPSGAIGVALRFSPVRWLEASIGTGVAFSYEWALPTTAAPSLGGGLALRLTTHQFAFGAGPTFAWTGWHMEHGITPDGVGTARTLTSVWWAGGEGFAELRYSDGGHIRIFAGAAAMTDAHEDTCTGEIQRCLVALRSTPVRLTLGVAFGATF